MELKRHLLDDAEQKEKSRPERRRRAADNTNTEICQRTRNCLMNRIRTGSFLVLGTKMLDKRNPVVDYIVHGQAHNDGHAYGFHEAEISSPRTMLPSTTETIPTIARIEMKLEMQD